MELKIEQKALAKLLARAAPACAAKSPMAALTHVLLRAEKNGQVTVQGTDLVLSVTAVDQAAVNTPGAVTVPARQLTEVVRSLSPSEVSLATSKDGSRLEVKSGKSRFKVPCTGAGDYPAVPEPHAESPRLRVPSRDLARLLEQTMYARSNDESRAFIACVRIEQSAGVVKCVALDSKRLALASTKLERADDWGADHINARALSDVKKLCEEFGAEPVSISEWGKLNGFLHFEWPGVTLSAKSAGSNFIPYQNLFPTNFQKVAGLGREDTIESLKRAALVGDSKECIVRCELKSGAFSITNVTAEKGEALEELEAEYQGEPMVFGINAMCFIEALRTMTDDTVLMQLNGPKDPLVLVGQHDDSCTALILFADLPEARS